MKTKNLISTAFIGIALIANLSYIACNKDDNSSAPSNSSTDNPSSLRTVSNSSSAQASYEDATNVAEEGASGNIETGNRAVDADLFHTSCAHISLDLNAMPHVLTIDFGTADCLGRDGNYRRGQILVSWSGHYFGAGSSHTITFNNYYVNFNKIDGSIAVADSGQNAMNHHVWNIIINGTVTVSPLYDSTGTSGTITFSASLIKEKIIGQPFYSHDDVYLITGTSSGTTVDGVTFSSTIDSSNPLRKENGFPNFTSGIVNLTWNNQAAVIDYSYLNSQRDNLASITMNNQTYIVILDNDGQITGHHI